MGLFSSKGGTNPRKMTGGFTVTSVSQGGRKVKAIRNETTKPAKGGGNRRPRQ